MHVLSDSAEYKHHQRKSVLSLKLENIIALKYKI